MMALILNDPSVTRSAMATTPGSTRVATLPDPADVEIRAVRTPEEYVACVDLQRQTWGYGFSDVVPVSMMQIVVKMGGICTGAFGPDGDLLGVVFGVTGIRGGELAHWSHMLAVRSNARNMGIGRRLKLAQKEELRAHEVNTMYWTFDPLVARNAHLNLNHLGATVAEYVPDMYGTSDSDLHQLGTDRFIAKWDLIGRRGSQDRTDQTAVLGDSGGSRPVIGAPGGSDRVPAEADVVEVLIPSDIEAIEAHSFEEAFSWRNSTRRAFTRLLDGPYDVTGFISGQDHARYIVSRTANR